ncbi:MAG: hypothetical protein KKA42_10450, partial [candidate division Zixibacteria bacterium]|nr:hypothetical protein [candidate division Zixibacteria bacterium]
MRYNRPNPPLHIHSLIVFATLFLGALSFCPRMVFGQVDGTGGEARLSPDAVDQLIVNIHPQQVVGAPLLTRSQILILDETSSLVTVYDLEADPITLSISSGTLAPTILDDNALFSAGVVNFLPSLVTYQGGTGTFSITAANSTVVSTGALV